MALRESPRQILRTAITLLLSASLGCHLPSVREIPTPTPTPEGMVARELEMVSLPTYTLAAPDILVINSVRLVPRAPYSIEPLDLLQISAAGAPPDQPIEGEYQVQPDGTVVLGPIYGSVPVVGLTPDEAATAIRRQLARILAQPEVSVSLLQPSGVQQIVGDHIIMPDGTVSLGTYGSVYVAGLTLAEARRAIEEHLSQFLEEPLIALSVLAYNSKVFYVVIEGAGQGDQVLRFPVTGNQTVLDALAQVQGLSRFSSNHIWIARPAPYGTGCAQILPVDWEEITRGGSTSTNYQILPGDRVFIAEDRLIALDAFLARATAPVERLFGTTLLGTQTIQVVNRLPLGFNFF